MSDVTLLFNNAELALASYSTLQNGSTADQAQILSLTQATGSQMSLTEATEFARRYPTVVTSFDESTTGLQLTVFKDTLGDLPGNLTISFRGTTIPQDLPTGADIVGAGAGYNQIVAMVNWWARASAPEGQMVQQFRLASYSLDALPADAVVLRSDAQSAFVLESAAPAAAFTGERNVSAALTADPDGRVDLTGHSLGGHLAMAFSSLFASRTGQVTVFNAPGFTNSTVNQEFFAKLGGAIPMGASIVNVAADEALVGDSPFNFIAGMHSRPGVLIDIIDIAIEKQTNSDEPNPFAPALNHSMVALVDSLAVYKLLADLAPTSGDNAFTTADYKRILNQAVQGTSAGYERIVDALQKLFTGDGELLETGNNKREALYQAIQDLTTDGSAYAARKGQLNIEAITGVAADSISNAQSNDPRGLAWRYALKELDPFVAIDVNGAGVYARYQAGGGNAGELDLYNADARTGTLTTQWLEDRAALLQRKLDIAAKDEINDIDKPLNLSNTNKSWESDSDYYEDRATGYIVNQGANGGQRVHDPYIIFGSGSADAIAGSSRADRLYGGGGTDYLIGKGDADYLEGGTGLDIYEYSSARQGLFATSADGHDTVLDVDGKGFLRYQYNDANGVSQTTVLAGVAIKEPDGKWKTPDGRFVLVLEQAGANLKVTFGADVDGSVTIRDFDFAKAAQGGYFGIRLVEAQALPETTRDIFGDYAYSPNPDGPPVLDDLGNLLPDPNSSVSTGVDVLQDSEGNDRIEGRMYSDWLVARRGGNDRISGGEERDYIEGGAGEDVIEGGEDGSAGYLGGGNFANDVIGGDVLFGGAGNDRLYGDVFKDTAELIRDGDIGPTGTIRGDVLDGGDGDDLLAGDVNGDVLLGGSGDDLLIGGASDDFLLGDAEQAFPELDLENPEAFSYWGWAITSAVNAASRSDSFHRFTFTEAAAPGRDLIYGGAGNDVAYAGGNDDVVWGESGDDWLFGEGGSDVLIGGLGNDVLTGDSESTPLDQQGDDYLDGGDGDDYLFGGAGNDILIGGAGLDQLIGGAGKDTYVFNRGDGTEIIIDHDASPGNPDASVLVLGEGISRDDIKFRKGSLMVDLGPSDPNDPLAGTDQIHFTSFNSDFPELTHTIGEIRFADGSSMNYADILAQGFDIDGTAFEDAGGTALIGTSVTDRIRGFAGNDELEGRDGDDVLIGDGGADRLDGGNGNDVLDGGANSDVLAGGMGSDDYRFIRGDGFDTLIEGSLFVRGLSDPDHTDRIVFGEDITRNDVSLFRTGDGNLTVRYGAGDEILVEGQYSVAGADIERIVFADGQTIEKAELDALEVGVVDGTADADEIYGTAGNDVLRGHDGDDYLDGAPAPERRIPGAPLQTGNDVLDGGTGSDTYALYWGMGADRIIDTVDGQANTLMLLDGATLESVRTTRDGDDLRVTLRGAGGGSATVQGFFADGGAASWQISSAADGSQSLLDFYVAQSALDNAPAIDAMLDYQQQLLSEWRAGSQPSLQLPTHAYMYSTWSQTISQWTGVIGSNPLPQTITTVHDPVIYRDVQGFGIGQGNRITSLPIVFNSVGQRFVDPLVVARTSDDAVIETQYSAERSIESLSLGFSVSGGPHATERTYTYSNGAMLNTVTESIAEGWAPMTFRNDGLEQFELRVQQVTEMPVIEQITAGASSNRIVGALFSSGDHVALIDAGAGDDEVTAGQYDFVFGNDGFDRITGGAYAFGGNDSDSLSGARFMAGGADDDFLSGGDGETTFYFRSNEWGWDWVEDQNGISLNEFALQAGFTDSYSNLIYGGKYRYLDTNFSYDTAVSDWAERHPEWPGFTWAELGHGLPHSEAPDRYAVLGVSNVFPRGVADELGREVAPAWRDGYYTSVFNTVEDMMRDFADLGIPFNPAEVQFIPEIADLSEFTADNHEALRPYFESGVLEKDVVVLDDVDGNGDALIVGFAPPDMFTDRRTLRLVWGDDKAIDIELPSATDLIGHGIEEVRLGQESIYIGDLIELAEEEGFLGTPFDDDLVGTAGDDRIRGLGGWDFIEGGAGNDLLSGGAGIDEFLFEEGSGSDTILDPDAEDIILFGDGVTPDQIRLGLGSLRLSYGSAGDEVHFQRFDPSDVYATTLFAALQFYDIQQGEQFPDGSFEQIWTLTDELTFEEVLSRGFDIDGTAGDDALTGTNIHDRFEGGTGNDVLAGGIGSDAYFFNAGDGVDTIIDAVETNEINRVVLRDYLESDITGVRDGQYVILQANGTGDAIRILWDEVSGAGVDAVEFANGVSWDRTVLANLAVSDINAPPVLEAPLSVQAALEDAAFNFTVPENTFRDPNSGDLLSYSATGADGSALPGWLTFDPETRTFSGTPDNADVGSVEVQVTATDHGGLSVSDAFTLNVVNVNDAPTLANMIADQDTLEDTAFSFVLPSDTFADVDAGDALMFSATLADGSPLPAWLTFDPATQAFTGTPGNDEVGTLSVMVTATDTADARATDTFDLTVVNVNDAPTVNNSIVNQYIAEGDALQFQLSADTFNDIDAGDTLTFSAALTDGAPLPAWLAFDAATRTFSGMADEGDIGTTGINVTARDGSGVTASHSFDLNVTVAPDKTLVGTGDDDLLASRSGNDTLDGLAGDDALFGRSGNDRLTGGLGDDLLVGGKGNDTYVYRPGDGLDMIADEAGNDAVAFGTGLTRANVVARTSEDSTIARVRVLDAYGNEQADQGLDVALDAGGNSPIEWFTFTTGAPATLDDLLIRQEIHTGTRRNDVIRTGRNDDLIYADRGNDVVYAGTGNDVIFGDRGRDILYGEAGNDVLIGGRGKDQLYGGFGDDVLEGGRGTDIVDGGAGFNTYVFERNFGDDRIVSSGGSGALRFGAGISARDLSFKRRDDDLVVKVKGEGRIRIEGWFNTKTMHPVERAEFADGTILSADKFVAKGYDTERERDEDDDDDDVSHYGNDDSGSRPHGASKNEDRDEMRPAKSTSGQGKNSEISDKAWFDKVAEKWNGHYARVAQGNAERDDARSGTSRGTQLVDRWQRMHDKLSAHLADGHDDDDDNGGADLASLKPGSAHGPSFAQFGPIGYGGVGVKDGSAADLRPFSGLREGLARIA